MSARKTTLTTTTAEVAVEELQQTTAATIAETSENAVENPLATNQSPEERDVSEEKLKRTRT